MLRILVEIIVFVPRARFVVGGGVRRYETSGHAGNADAAPVGAGTTRGRLLL